VIVYSLCTKNVMVTDDFYVKKDIMGILVLAAVLNIHLY
jgi:hypothetical protein